MKKLLLLALCLASPAMMFGQGTVVFNNNAGTQYRLWTNGPVGGQSNLMSGANGYRIGLYGSTDLGAAEGSLTLLLLATNAPIAAVAGRFDGGAAAATGLTAGTQIRFQLRAWTFSAGTSHAAALAAQALDPLGVATGTSPLGTTTVGGGTVLPGALFGTSAGLLTGGFQIAPIPEPSSVALGLLGLGAVALFRRRK